MSTRVIDRPDIRVLSSIGYAEELEKKVAALTKQRDELRLIVLMYASAYGCVSCDHDFGENFCEHKPDCEVKLALANAKE